MTPIKSTPNPIPKLIRVVDHGLRFAWVSRPFAACCHETPTPKTAGTKTIHIGPSKFHVPETAMKTAATPNPAPRSRNGVMARRPAGPMARTSITRPPIVSPQTKETENRASPNTGDTALWLKTNAAPAAPASVNDHGISRRVIASRVAVSPARTRCDTSAIPIKTMRPPANDSPAATRPSPSAEPSRPLM